MVEKDICMCVTTWTIKINFNYIFHMDGWKMRFTRVKYIYIYIWVIWLYLPLIRRISYQSPWGLLWVKENNEKQMDLRWYKFRGLTDTISYEVVSNRT